MKGLTEMLQNHSIYFCLLFQKRDLFAIYQRPLWGSLVAQWLKKKNLPSNARDVSLIPGLGRSPGEGNGNLLQYSCLGKIPQTEEPGEPQSMESQELDKT